AFLIRVSLTPFLLGTILNHLIEDQRRLLEMASHQFRFISNSLSDSAERGIIRLRNLFLELLPPSLPFSMLRFTFLLVRCYSKAQATTTFIITLHYLAQLILIVSVSACQQSGASH